MKRPFLAGTIAVAAVTGVCITAVILLTDPSPPGAEPTVSVPSSPEPGAGAHETAPDPGPPPRTVARREGGIAGAMWRSSAVDDASPLPWADRVTRKAVRRALLAPALQSRLARCVDRDVGFGAAPGIVPRDRAATIAIVVETGGREARIVDVQVQRWGGASLDTFACARNVLLGTSVAAATPGPARRVRMPYPLNPKREALAAVR